MLKSPFVSSSVVCCVFNSSWSASLLGIAGLDPLCYLRKLGGRSVDLRTLSQISVICCWWCLCSVDPTDQKKTACYDIDVEVEDPLKGQMSSFLLSTANQQEISALDNKVGLLGWAGDPSIENWMTLGALCLSRTPTMGVIPATDINRGALFLPLTPRMGNWLPPIPKTHCLLPLTQGQLLLPMATVCSPKV